MSFTDSIRSGFDNYVNFDGRASRPMYWWWVLFAILASIAANIVDAVIGAPIFSILVGLGLFLPGLAVAVRRLHDTDRSGWWILIGLIPIIGFIVLLVFLVQKSDPVDNRVRSAPGGPGSRGRRAASPRSGRLACPRNLASSRATAMPSPSILTPSVTATGSGRCASSSESRRSG